MYSSVNNRQNRGAILDWCEYKSDYEHFVILFVSRTLIILENWFTNSLISLQRWVTPTAFKCKASIQLVNWEVLWISKQSCLVANWAWDDENECREHASLLQRKAQRIRLDSFLVETKELSFGVNSLIKAVKNSK